MVTVIWKLYVFFCGVLEIIYFPFQEQKKKKQKTKKTNPGNITMMELTHPYMPSYSPDSSQQEYLRE